MEETPHSRKLQASGACRALQGIVIPACRLLLAQEFLDLWDDCLEPATWRRDVAFLLCW